MIESIENLSRKREWGGGGLPGGIEGFERTLKEGISLCRRGGGGCNGGMTGELDQMITISFPESLISKP